MPEKKRRRFLFAAVYSLVVAAFTAYVMLDTFVLESVEQTDATAQKTSMFDDIEVKKLTADSDSSQTEQSKATPQSTKPSKGKRSRTKSTDDISSQA